jgi:hypothetical protein
MKHLKSFSIVILLTTVLFSCKMDEQYYNPVSKSDSISGNIVQYKGYEYETITYDEHDYIVCRDISGGWHAVTMVHSASCKKCSKKMF